MIQFTQVSWLKLCNTKEKQQNLSVLIVTLELSYQSKEKDEKEKMHQTLLKRSPAWLTSVAYGRNKGWKVLADQE